MRCAVCGSTKIVTETKKEGYNLKKGIVGSVLFGGIGAIAGTSGNEVSYYHCGDCGQTLNKCMHEYEEMELEFALKTQDSADTFFINRVNKMKNKYPNAGWDENKILNAHIKMKYNKNEFDENELVDISSYIRKSGSISKTELVSYLEQNGYNSNLANRIESYFSYDVYTHKYRIQIDFKDNDLIFSYYNGDSFIVDRRPLYHHNGLALSSKGRRDRLEYEAKYNDDELEKIIINVFKDEHLIIDSLNLIDIRGNDDILVHISSRRISQLCKQLVNKNLLKFDENTKKYSLKQ